jgi:hypothetical protein
MTQIPKFQGSKVAAVLVGKNTEKIIRMNHFCSKFSLTLK